MFILFNILGLLLGLFIFSKIIFSNTNNETDSKTKLESKASNITAMSLSIIVPARNEEHNLNNLLQSIENQNVRINEVIVVDDHSTDKTADIAQQYKAKVIKAPDLPKGWKGKPHACFVGANQAQSDYLLFLDADTSFLNENSLSNITKQLNNPNLISSWCPFHSMHKLYESLSLFFHMMMLAGTGSFTLNASSFNQSKLFGQSLLIAKNTYFKIGSHKSVKDKILENFHLAKTAKKYGFKLFADVGTGILNMRMYPKGIKELILGWQKSFASGAKSTQTWLFVAIFIWLTALIQIPIFALKQCNIVHIALYILACLQLYFIGKKIGNYSIFSIVLYPIGLVFFFAVFLSSLIKQNTGQKTNWKGRAVSE